MSYSPVIAQRLRKYLSYIILITTTATVVTLFIYRQFFYPCPWYEINALRDDAARLGNSQPSIISQIGQRLCDCGEASIGWDLQAKSEYWSQQYRTAINFWRRSIAADPTKAHRINSNIADASIWLGDYLSAKELYRKAYQSNTDNEHYRYGLGRSLTFAGDYGEAIKLLEGMNPAFSDGGSTGQVLVIEGIARLGSVRSSDNSSARNAQENIARNKFCTAIAINHNWKDWLIGAAVGTSNSGNLQVFKDLIRPVMDLNCGK